MPILTLGSPASIFIRVGTVTPMRVAHEASDSLRRRRATARSAPSLANASSVAGGSWSVALDRLPIKYTIAKQGLLYNYNLLLGYEIGLADVWTSTDSLCCTAVGDGHLGRAGALEPRRDQSLELLRRRSASSRAGQREHPIRCRHGASTMVQTGTPCDYKVAWGSGRTD